jgi:hypothetical protein
MIAFPTSPEGGYEAVQVERREWWQFPGMRLVVVAGLIFGGIVAVIQYVSANP